MIAAMKYTDIAIIGGGLAGSTAAAMLGRAGIATILVDPHPVYPPDFRVEKLSGDEQIARFHKTGLGEAVLRKAAHASENWIARSGVLLDKQDGQTELAADQAQQLHQLLDHDRRKPERQLVDQEQCRSAQQRYTDREHLLFAAAEVAGELCLPLGEAGEIAQHALARDAARLSCGKREVLLHA